MYVCMMYIYIILYFIIIVVHSLAIDYNTRFFPCVELYSPFYFLLHVDVSAVLHLDDTHLLHLVLCPENVSQLFHAVLYVRCHVAQRVSFERTTSE